MKTNAASGRFSYWTWVAAIALSATTASRAGAPVVFKAVDPVRPGEAVLLYGHGLADTLAVLVGRLPDGDPGQPPDATGVEMSAVEWLKADVLLKRNVSVQAALPRALKPGIYAVRVQIPSGEASRRILVNRPDPWWVQGDVGTTASPGGWVRVFGKCFAPKGKPVTVSLRGPRKLSLTSTAGDAFTRKSCHA